MSGALVVALSAGGVLYFADYDSEVGEAMESALLQVVQQIPQGQSLVEWDLDDPATTTLGSGEATVVADDDKEISVGATLTIGQDAKLELTVTHPKKAGVDFREQLEATKAAIEAGLIPDGVPGGRTSGARAALLTAVNALLSGDTTTMALNPQDAYLYYGGGYTYSASVFSTGPDLYWAIIINSDWTVQFGFDEVSGYFDSPPNTVTGSSPMECQLADIYNGATEYFSNPLSGVSFVNEDGTGYRTTTMTIPLTDTTPARQTETWSPDDPDDRVTVSGDVTAVYQGQPGIGVAQRCTYCRTVIGYPEADFSVSLSSAGEDIAGDFTAEANSTLSAAMGIAIAAFRRNGQGDTVCGDTDFSDDLSGSIFTSGYGRASVTTEDGKVQSTVTMYTNGIQGGVLQLTTTLPGQAGVNLLELWQSVQGKFPSSGTMSPEGVEQISSILDSLVKRYPVAEVEPVFDDFFVTINDYPVIAQLSDDGTTLNISVGDTAFQLSASYSITSGRLDSTISAVKMSGTDKEYDFSVGDSADSNNFPTSLSLQVRTAEENAITITETIPLVLTSAPHSTGIVDLGLTNPGVRFNVSGDGIRLIYSATPMTFNCDPLPEPPLTTQDRIMALEHYGKRKLGETVQIPFLTWYDSELYSPEAVEVRIFKDGNATAKTTENGVVFATDFDGQPGFHLLLLDTSNSTGDADFWEAGHQYQVLIISTRAVPAPATGDSESASDSSSNSSSASDSGSDSSSDSTSAGEEELFDTLGGATFQLVD